jgi:hypothetical protein
LESRLQTVSYNTLKVRLNDKVVDLTELGKAQISVGYFVLS